MSGPPAAPIETVCQSRDGVGAQPSSPLVVLGKPGFHFWWHELPRGTEVSLALGTRWVELGVQQPDTQPHPTLVWSLEMAQQKQDGASGPGSTTNGDLGRVTRPP